MENKRVKSIEKKVYGLLVESKKTFFLSVQVAYSLEEAFFLAKLEFESLNPRARGSNDIIDAKIGLFSMKTLEQVNHFEDLPDIISIDSSPVKANPDRDPWDGISPEDEMEMMMRTINGGMNKKRSFKRSQDVIIPLNTPEDAKFEVKPEQEKNELMRKIIKDKDIELFTVNRGKFTDAEAKYIEERLK